MALLPTTLVGSYPQPEWLIDRAKLAGRFPPRVRAKELWRVAAPYLEEAQNDATLLAIRDLERPGTALDRSGHSNPVPRIVGKIRRKHAVEVEDLLFLRRNTRKQVKMT